MKPLFMAGRKRTWWLISLLNPFWLLFGNVDDGLFGDEAWRAGRAKSFGLAFAWWRRNPFHNLTHYLIGVVLFDRWVLGLDIDRPGFTWSITVARWLPIPLPFIGFNGIKVVRYIGWRPSGAFGCKLRHAKT